MTTSHGRFCAILSCALAADRVSRDGNCNGSPDQNWIIDYYRRSADHRLLFGGRVSYSGLEQFEAVPVTRARMLRVFPQ